VHGRNLPRLVGSHLRDISHRDSMLRKASYKSHRLLHHLLPISMSQRRASALLEPSFANGEIAAQSIEPGLIKSFSAFIIIFFSQIKLKE
jgi:hypothetical protein